jgi:hypothetical protein
MEGIVRLSQSLGQTLGQTRPVGVVAVAESPAVKGAVTVIAVDSAVVELVLVVTVMGLTMLPGSLQTPELK